MLITNLAMIEAVLRRNAGARGPMQRWIEIVQGAEWHNIMDVRRNFPHADAIRGTELTCFNIGGNSFRLMTTIGYELQELAIVELMTHAQYTKKYVR